MNLIPVHDVSLTKMSYTIHTYYTQGMVSQIMGWT